jgi:hypothetical protein
VALNASDREFPTRAREQRLQPPQPSVRNIFQRLRVSGRFSSPTVRWRRAKKRIKETETQPSNMIMMSSEFRVESDHPISGRQLPVSDSRQYSIGDHPLAVAMAEESDTQPSGREIRVVHVPTGEVVFRKSASAPPEFSDEF